MKTILALFLAITMTQSVLAATMTLDGELSTTYVTKGYPTRDALLSAFFALSAEQQQTAHMSPVSSLPDCTWSEPWLLMYRNMPGDLDGPNYETFTVPNVAIDNLTPLLSWLGSEGLLVKQLSPTPIGTMLFVKWRGSACNQ